MGIDLGRTSIRGTRRSRLVLLGICLLAFSIGANAAAVNYILEVRPGTNGAAIAARYGLTVTNTWQDATHIAYAVSAPQALSAGMLLQIKAETGFLELETDVPVQTAEAGSQSRPPVPQEALGAWFFNRVRTTFYGSLVLDGYVHQPGTTIVRADDANRQFGAGAGVVAIIDTGVDTNHAALRDVLVPGYDFTRDRSDTVSELYDLDPATAAALQQSTVEILDSWRPAVVVNPTTVAILSQSTVEILDGMRLPTAFGHGTMVAGLVHRVAPTARIMPLKAFRSDGSATLSGIVRAIRYAVDHGASVISMSFSFASPSVELQSAIQYALDRGVLCVASAGNLGKATSVYPASISGVIGVGSTNYSDKRSAFSNYGAAARTSAPGEALLTTFPGNTYAGVWGTSFSTGLVSGASAVFRQREPRMRADKLDDTLDYGVRIEQGMGDARLDLWRSLTYLCNQR